MGNLWFYSGVTRYKVQEHFMSKVVHVQTTIQTVFGVLDEDYNVMPQDPVVVHVCLFRRQRPSPRLTRSSLKHAIRRSRT